MKRVIRNTLLLCICMLTAALTACQATPDAPIVVQKDMEQMIERADSAPAFAEGDARLAIRERYGFPAEYDYRTEKGKLQIDVKAGVDVPDVYLMPIVRVAARDFTQEEVSRLFDLLCGEKTMYILPDRMSKTQIEEQLIRAKKNAAQLAASGNEDDISTAAYYADELVPMLEELYASAPEDNELVPSDGTLGRMELTDPDGGVIGSYLGLHAAENAVPGYIKDFGAQFWVKNNDDMLTSAVFSENAMHLSGRAKATGAGLFYSAAAANAFNAPNSKMPLPTDAAQKAGVLPDEARTIVKSFLEANSLPFDTYDIGFAQGESSGSDPKPYCYMLECRRIVEGVPCASTGVGASYASNDALAESWDYERMSFRVDGSGIISMNWNSPLTIMNTVVEDCTLMPFEDIVSVFEKMMPISHEPLAREDFMGSVNFDIDRVSLEFVRVTEQNSIGHGLLVPAWCFYGTRTAIYNDGTRYDHHSDGYGCHLIVNAVDGSVIDPQKGY